MSLRTRSAGPEDAELVHRFICELATYERLAHEVTATVEDVRSALADPKGGPFALIAEWDGEPCGFALWFFDFSTFVARRGIYLEDLYVRESHRGRGVGKALLAELARLAKDIGCARLEWAVLDWNAPSIAFYKSLGAVPMSDWTVYRLSGEALDALAEKAQA
jgi:diamine N-acetyltransferase